MMAPWAPHQGFNALARQIDDGIMFSNFAQNPLSNKDIENMLLIVIKGCGFLAAEYKEWKGLAPTERTWTKAKTWWKAKIRLAGNTATTADAASGYVANVTGSVSELPAEVYTNDAITEVLNNAQGHSNQQILQMQQGQQQLQMQNQALFQQMNWMQQQMQSGNNSNNNNTFNNSNNNNRGKKKKQKKQWNNSAGNIGGGNFGGNNNFNNGYNNGAMGTGWNPTTNQFDRKNWPMEVCSQSVPKYCWSHGWDCNHTSNECRRRQPGHQNNATRTNSMGGNPTNAHRTILPQTRGLNGKPPSTNYGSMQTAGNNRQQFQQQWQPQQQANMSMVVPGTVQHQQANMGMQIPGMI